MLDADETTGPPSVEETIEYISDMLLSLEEMARRNELQALAELIDDAHAEARRQAKKIS